MHSGLRLDVHPSGTSMYTVMPVPRSFLTIHNPEKPVIVKVRGPNPSPSAGLFQKRITLQLFFSPIINCQENYVFNDAYTSVNLSCTLYSHPSGEEAKTHFCASLQIRHRVILTKVFHEKCKKNAEKIILEIPKETFFAITRYQMF